MCKPESTVVIVNPFLVTLVQDSNLFPSINVIVPIKEVSSSSGHMEDLTLELIQMFPVNVNTLM